ncbi:MAG: type 4a pilus biogenesis protein PilO [Patescibacteria group bacterium]
MAYNTGGQIGKYKRYFSNIRVFYEQRQDIKMFMEILLSLLTISMFAIFAIRPTLLTIGQLLTDIQNKEDTVAKLNIKIQNLKTAQEVYDNSADVLSILDTAIPASTSIDSAVRQLEGITQKNNVTISSISIGESPIKGDGKVSKSEKEVAVLPTNSEGLTMNFNVSGDYLSLMTFLQDLQNMRRPMFIDQVVINNPDAEDGKIIMSVIARNIYEK